MVRLILFTAVVILIYVQPFVQGQDFVTDGLVSFWTFDQRDIQENMLRDVWGHNHGMMTDTEIGPGKIGEALTFNGTSSLVSIANDASLELTDAFTLEAWLNLGVWQVAERHIILGHYDQNQGKRHIQFACKPDVGISAYLGHSNGTAYVQVQSGAQHPEWVSNWVHATTTWAKDDDGLPRIYIDGEELEGYESQQPWEDELSMNDLPWTIGAMPGFNRFFEGAIDELRVYSRRLTDEEIRANSLVESNTLAVKPTGKLAVTWSGLR